MRQGLVERIHRHDVHLIVHELRVVAALVVVEELHFPLHRGEQCRQVGRAVLVDEQRVERIAHRNAARLGVAHNPAPLLQVAVPVKIDVNHTCSRLDDRHARRVANEINEPAPASRYAHVDIPHRREHLGRGLVGGRQEGQHILAHAHRPQHALDDLHRFLVGGRSVAPALQHTGIPAFQAQGKHVEGHIGASLVHNAHHTERHTHATQAEPVGQCAFLGLDA